MPLKMDFTTTAVARPMIVNKTYESFARNLKGINLKNCRLFINVDPLPPDVNRKNVVKVARKYFGEVHANFPEEANFTAAYNWIWSNAETKYIFNIEDDWQLIREVNVRQLLSFFEKAPKLMQVALRAYRYRYLSVALSPSILHERFYKAVAGNLNPKRNPEAQIRGKNFGLKMPARSLKISHKGKVIGYPGNIKQIAVRDIGRGWMKRSKYRKPRSSKTRFVTWEQK